MNITTQDIIKILTIDDEFKKKLLTEWDTFSEDQQLNLTEIIWDTYADLYQLRYEINAEIALQELSEGKESVDSKFAHRIREKTDDEFEQVFQQGLPVSSLVETREKLQDLIQTVVPNATTPASDATPNESSN
jgi:hypothetical protein